jgi:hypothetical protein
MESGDDKAFSREYQTPELSKDLVRKTDTQPQREKPNNRKATGGREQQLPGIRPENWYENNCERNSYRERCSTERRKSGVKEFEITAVRTANHSRPAKTILAERLQRFSLMFDTP